MERNCHRCNKRFNPDNSESETVCQSCMDLQKAGQPPVKFKQLTWVEMAKARREKLIDSGARLCMACGEPISPLEGPSMFCTDCFNKKVWNSTSYRQRTTKKVYPKRTCLSCGKEFQPNDPRQRLCSPECKHARHNWNQKQRLMRIKQKGANQ